MKLKAFIKRIIDAAMTLLLPVLMAEILTGQQAHEWLGTGMMLLFILHHILNLGWMRNLFKGKYSPLRCAGTALNTGSGILYPGCCDCCCDFFPES